MRALIMAGGAGRRLARGEKPLVLINGQPMIRPVADAFSGAGCEPVIVVSQKTPMTANWCRAHGLAIVTTRGAGYVEDMIEAVRYLEESGPVIVCVSDIPGITTGIVARVLDAYHHCGKDALSTWIPAVLVKSCRGGMPYRETINGVEACPAGLNILRGALIGSEQDESPLLLNDPRLAMNVNTPGDLTRTEEFLRSGRGQDLPSSGFDQH